MKYLPLFALITLCSCAAQGPRFTDIKNDILSPAPNEAKVILYRPNHTLGMGSTFWVELNGIQICDLHNASFMVVKINQGLNVITSSQFGRIGTSRIEVKAASSDVVFIKMNPNNLGASLMGVAGDALSNGGDGPVDLIKVSENSAMSDLSDLNFEEKCQ